MKKVFLFDWGDTIMKDYTDEKGPMCSWSKIDAMPFAEEMLKELSQKADCYIATNAKDSTKEEIIKALERVHVANYFKDVFCYRELGVSKPSLEYFDYIIKQLGVAKDEVIMIGDNLDADVKGVINIGIDAILYDRENKYPEYQGLKIDNLMMILKLSNDL